MGCGCGGNKSSTSKSSTTNKSTTNNEIVVPEGMVMRNGKLYIVGT